MNGGSALNQMESSSNPTTPPLGVKLLVPLSDPSGPFWGKDPLNCPAYI